MSTKLSFTPPGWLLQLYNMNNHVFHNISNNTNSLMINTLGVLTNTQTTVPKQKRAKSSSSPTSSTVTQLSNVKLMISDRQDDDQ